MGRDVMRVALDFDWALNKTWDGFINPFEYDEDAEEQSAEYEAWQETPPPAGDGWQLWENVSEGSPVSPVFKTREELLVWMADNKYANWVLKEVAEHGEKSYIPSAWGLLGKFYGTHDNVREDLLCLLGHT